VLATKRKGGKEVGREGRREGAKAYLPRCSSRSERRHRNVNAVLVTKRKKGKEGEREGRREGGSEGVPAQMQP